MAKNTGINNRNLKKQNRGLILKLIATNTNTSRIELSRMSRLTKMSVSNIISEFIDKGLVEETTYETKVNVGRTPIILDISPKAPKFMGVWINRDECTVVLCDLKLNILKSESKVIIDYDRLSFISTIYDLIDKIKGRRSDIAGIGVSSIGPVDIKKGIILAPPNFYNITNVPIVEILRERYQLPVFLDNHYNAAALAEKLYGNGKEYSDFVFLGITNGIGSGIISEGQIYRNSNGLTSELGHTSIDYNGPQCGCGRRGCLETYISTKVIMKALREKTGMNLSFREFCEISDQNIVDEIFLDMIEKLSIGLVNGVNLLNPQAIIMGHESVYLPDHYIKLLEENINQYKLSGKHNHVNVIKPYFGHKAQLIGSGCCVINHVFNGKILFE